MLPVPSLAIMSPCCLSSVARQSRRLLRRQPVLHLIFALGLIIRTFDPSGVTIYKAKAAAGPRKSKRSCRAFLNEVFASLSAS